MTIHLRKLAIFVLLTGCTLGCPSTPTRPDGQPDRQAPPTPESLVWAKVLYEQPEGTIGGVALSLDDEGELVMAGRMWAAPTGPSLFLARTPTEGDASWSKVAFAEDWGEHVALAAGPDGEIYLAASFLGTTRLGGGEAGKIGHWHLLLARVRAEDGMLVWQRTFPMAASKVSPRLAVDGNGHVFLAGHFDGRLDLDLGTLTADPQGDLFAAKFLPSGEQVWANRLGGPGHHRLAAARVDGNGRLLLAGSSRQALEIPGLDLEGSKTLWAFIVRLGQEGKPDWAQAIAADGQTQAKDLVAFADGSMILIGSHLGSLNVGGQSALSRGDRQACFAVRIDPERGVRWLKSFSSSEQLGCQKAGTDGRRSLWLAGDLKGKASLGTVEFQAAGSGSLWAARLDAATGTPLWAQALGRAEAGPIGVRALVAAPGFVLLAGAFVGAFPFGPDRWYAGPDPFALLFKLRPGMRP